MIYRIRLDSESVPGDVKKVEDQFATLGQRAAAAWDLADRGVGPMASRAMQGIAPAQFLPSTSSQIAAGDRALAAIVAQVQQSAQSAQAARFNPSLSGSPQAINSGDVLADDGRGGRGRGRGGGGGGGGGGGDRGEQPGRFTIFDGKSIFAQGPEGTIMRMGSPWDAATMAVTATTTARNQGNLPSANENAAAGVFSMFGPMGRFAGSVLSADANEMSKEEQLLLSRYRLWQTGGNDAMQLFGRGVTGDLSKQMMRLGVGPKDQAEILSDLSRGTGKATQSEFLTAAGAQSSFGLGKEMTSLLGAAAKTGMGEDDRLRLQADIFGEAFANKLDKGRTFELFANTQRAVAQVMGGVANIAAIGAEQTFINAISPAFRGDTASHHAAEAAFAATNQSTFGLMAAMDAAGGDYAKARVMQSLPNTQGGIPETAGFEQFMQRLGPAGETGDPYQIALIASSIPELRGISPGILKQMIAAYQAKPLAMKFMASPARWLVEQTLPPGVEMLRAMFRAAVPQDNDPTPNWVHNLQTKMGFYRKDKEPGKPGWYSSVFDIDRYATSQRAAGEPDLTMSEDQMQPPTMEETTRRATGWFSPSSKLSPAKDPITAVQALGRQIQQQVQMILSRANELTITVLDGRLLIGNGIGAGALSGLPPGTAAPASK